MTGDNRTYPIRIKTLYENKKMGIQIAELTFLEEKKR
jgi:hypothetical protein